MTLPAWQVRRLAGGKLGLTCPRKDCGGKVVVRGRQWRLGVASAAGTVGRVCPYCFRTSAIPESVRNRTEGQ